MVAGGGVAAAVIFSATSLVSFQNIPKTLPVAGVAIPAVSIRVFCDGMDERICRRDKDANSVEIRLNL